MIYIFSFLEKSSFDFSPIPDDQHQKSSWLALLIGLCGVLISSSTLLCCTTLYCCWRAKTFKKRVPYIRKPLKPAFKTKKRKVLSNFLRKKKRRDIDEISTPEELRQTRKAQKNKTTFYKSPNRDIPLFNLIPHQAASSTFDPRASHFTGSTEADDVLANYPFLANPEPPADSGLSSFKRFVQPFLSSQNQRANLNAHARFPRVDDSANIYQEPLIEFHHQFHQQKQLDQQQQLQQQKEQLQEQQQQLQQLQQQIAKNELTSQRQRHREEEKLTASIKRTPKLSRPRRPLPLEEESARLREFSYTLDERADIAKPKALPTKSEEISLPKNASSQQQLGAIPKQKAPPLSRCDDDDDDIDDKKERERIIFYQDSESSF